MPTTKDKTEKIQRIASEIVNRKGFVAPIDILLNLGNLAPSSVEDWRKGRVPYLEQVVQANLSKISDYLNCLRRWGTENGLTASRTAYVSSTRRRELLRFSKSGAKHIEELFSTHFVSPTLKKEKLERLQKEFTDPDLLCFIVVTDSACSQCETELPKGSFLFKEKDTALCLPCAKLDHLEFLPSGERKVTLRATKYSEKLVVVVRFNRSSKRYEREGILVTKDAIEQAELECAAAGAVGA